MEKKLSFYLSRDLNGVGVVFTSKPSFDGVNWRSSGEFCIPKEKDFNALLGDEILDCGKSFLKIDLIETPVCFKKCKKKG